MNSEEVEELKRHFGVMAEGLRHDLQQIAEGHQVILSHVQQFRQEVQEEFKEARTISSCPPNGARPCLPPQRAHVPRRLPIHRCSV